MTGIERLRELADTLRENIGDMRLSSSSEPLWRIIINIADQIEREHRERNGALEEENERLRDMLNEVAWGLGLGGSAHYYSDDNYQDCQESVLAAIDRRLMPEGMEWPRYEDGEMVFVGSDFADGLGETHTVTSVEFFDGCVELHWNPDEPGEFEYLHPGERVRRPASKVLDADGVEIRVGDTVWGTRESKSGTVVYAYPPGDDGQPSVKVGAFWHHASELTHRAPVLAADGRPLREGETVWSAATGASYTVKIIGDGLVPIECDDVMGCPAHLHPSQLTHERPDSLDRLAEDISAMVVAWRANQDLFDAQEAAAGCVGENTLGAALDSLVRRAKALAERDR